MQPIATLPSACSYLIYCPQGQMAVQACRYKCLAHAYAVAGASRSPSLPRSHARSLSSSLARSLPRFPARSLHSSLAPSLPAYPTVCLPACLRLSCSSFSLWPPTQANRMRRRGSRRRRARPRDGSVCICIRATAATCACAGRAVRIRTLRRAASARPSALLSGLPSLFVFLSVSNTTRTDDGRRETGTRACPLARPLDGRPVCSAARVRFRLLRRRPSECTVSAFPSTRARRAPRARGVRPARRHVLGASARTRARRTQRPGSERAVPWRRAGESSRRPAATASRARKSLQPPSRRPYPFHRRTRTIACGSRQLAGRLQSPRSDPRSITPRPADSRARRLSRAGDDSIGDGRLRPAGSQEGSAARVPAR